MKQNLLGLKDLSAEEIMNVLETAKQMKKVVKSPDKKINNLSGKTVVNLFYENSTRTRLSFELAAKYMSANAANITASGSSVQKGESLIDTAETINAMAADILVIRHSMSGAPHLIAPLLDASVINAGDGGHNHPTQTLADLLTIYREKGGFSNLTVGFCGDLKFGRTVHSLINALSRYSGLNLVLISPDELQLPDYELDVIKKHNIPYLRTASLESAIPQLDILYMTRVQKERFFNEEDYLRLRDSYILTPQKLENAKPELCIMHPLPRVNEISTAVDSDPRACYFKQVLYGKYMRMAVILLLLEEGQK